MWDQSRWSIRNWRGENTALRRLSSRGEGPCVISGGPYMPLRVPRATPLRLSHEGKNKRQGLIRSGLRQRQRMNTSHKSQPPPERLLSAAGQPAFATAEAIAVDAAGRLNIHGFTGRPACIRCAWVDLCSPPHCPDVRVAP